MATCGTLAPAAVVLLAAGAVSMRAGVARADFEKELPPTATAREWIAAGRLDDLYFSYASVRRGQHPEGDAKLGPVMVEATRASLKKGDKVLALGFAEAAVRLLPRSVEAAVSLAEVDLELSLFGAAAKALETALAYAPKDGELHFRRATLAAAEAELTLAASHFAQVAADHPRHAEAQVAAAAVAEKLRSKEDALANLEGVQRKIKAAVSRVQRNAESANREFVEEASTGIDLGRETMNSMRTRAKRDSDHFTLSYEIGSRGWKKREKWVISVIVLLERAWQAVGDRLDFHPDRLFDVIAHTAKSYRARFHKNNPGMYSAGTIHLNRSSDPSTRQFFATVVHEYVHAVLDALASPRYHRLPNWFNEGTATYLEAEIAGRGRPPPSIVAQARKLSPAALEKQTRFKSSNPSPAYAKSRFLVAALVADGGSENLRHVCDEVSDGATFDDALGRTFGRWLVARLDDEANTRLAGP